jgi:hypothetical protein
MDRALLIESIIRSKRVLAERIGWTGSVYDLRTTIPSGRGSVGPLAAARLNGIETPSLIVRERLASSRK